MKSVKDFPNYMQKCERFFPWMALLTVDVGEESKWIRDLWGSQAKGVETQAGKRKKGRRLSGAGADWPWLTICGHRMRLLQIEQPQRRPVISGPRDVSHTPWRKPGVPPMTLILLPKIWTNTHSNCDTGWVRVLAVLITTTSPESHFQLSLTIPSSMVITNSHVTPVRINPRDGNNHQKEKNNHIQSRADLSD